MDSETGSPPQIRFVSTHLISTALAQNKAHEQFSSYYLENLAVGLWVYSSNSVAWPLQALLQCQLGSINTNTYYPSRNTRQLK